MFEERCRSMEAHARLSKKGFNVASFGTGDKVSQRVLKEYKVNLFSGEATRPQC